MGRVNHARMADLLATVYHAHVAADRALAAAGLVSWRDDARRESLAVFEHLQAMRAALDIHIEIHLASSTRIAVAAARAEQRDHDLAEQVRRERRQVAHGNAFWTARRAGGTPFGSSPGGRGYRGDDDCPAPLHEAPHEIAPVPPPLAPEAATGAQDDREPTETHDALSGPLMQP